MTNIRLWVGCCAALAVGLSASAAERTWTGLGGNDLWSTPANWSETTLPADGDTVVFANAGAEALVTTDNLPELKLAAVCVLAGGPVTIDGEQLDLSGATSGLAKGCLVTNGCSLLTLNAPLALSGTGSVYFGGNINFNGAVEIADGKNVTLAREYAVSGAARRMDFNAPVTGPDATLTLGYLDLNVVYFNQPVTVREVKGTSNGYAHFCAAGNAWQTISTRYNWMYFDTADAMDPEAVLNWNTEGGDRWYRGVWILNADQTCGGLVSPQNYTHSYGPVRYTVCGQNTSRNAVLTIRPAQDLECWARLGVTEDGSAGKYLSVVYDALGDYTQTMHDRTHEMAGTITVRNGTLKFDGAAKLPSVTEVNVEGGTFHLDCTNQETVFSSKLTRVRVGKDGLFKVTSTYNPFKGWTSDLVIAKGGKVHVGKDRILKMSRVSYGGVWLPKATYTRKTAEWVEGEGNVQLQNTETSWKEAADGDWNEADNWTAAPTTGKPANVTAEGDDYTVSVTDNTVVPSKLTVGNLGEGQATLDVSGTFTLTNACLAIEEGGVVNVGAGQSLLMEGSPSTSTSTERLAVRNGGVLQIAGDVLLTNVIGKMVVEGTESATGTVRQTGGRFRWMPASNKSKFTVNPYGRVEVTGGTGLVWTASLDMNGGVVDVSQNGCFGLRGSSVTIGTGVYRFRDNGQWHWTSNGSGSDRHTITPDKAGEKVVFDFGDNARTVGPNGLDGSCDRLVVNNTLGGETIFNVDTTKSVYLSLCTLFGQNGRAELNLKNGTVKTGMYSMFIGTGEFVTTDGLNATGVVRVAGGTLAIAGSNFTADGSRIQGAVIGDGSYVNASTKSPNSRFYGHVFLSGTGKVEHTSSVPCYIGVGPRAYGEVVQDGGSFVMNDASRSFIIGMAGGTGRYVISNGTATVAKNLFVGGALTNHVGWSGCSTFPPDHGGQGLLKVAGGTFTAQNNVYSGVEGNGTIEIGPAGKLAITKDLVLSNAVESAYTRYSTLRFELGQDGCGLIDLKGAMQVESGAKLYVDATAYWHAKRVQLIKSTKLADCAWFADGDVTLLGGDVRLIRDANGLWLKRNVGALLLVR